MATASKVSSKKVVKFVPQAEASVAEATEGEKPQRVYLKNRFKSKEEFKKFTKELRSTRNASEVAKAWGLNPITVIQFAKREEIKLQAPGRPPVYKYNKGTLLPQLRKALKERGGLVQLAEKVGIPYQTLRNLAVKHNCMPVAAPKEVAAE